MPFPSNKQQIITFLLSYTSITKRSIFLGNHVLSSNHAEGSTLHPLLQASVAQRPSESSSPQPLSCILPVCCHVWPLEHSMITTRTGKSVRTCPVSLTSLTSFCDGSLIIGFLSFGLWLF